MGWVAWGQNQYPQTIHGMKHQIIIQGRIPQQAMPAFAKVLTPVLFVKQAITSLQLALQQLVWDELIHGKTVSGNIFQAAAFVAFCGFCLVSYAAHQAHIPWILIGAILCGVEGWLARYAYDNGPAAKVTLDKGPKDYQWRLAYPNGADDRKRFLATDVKSLAIGRRPLYVGRSGESIAMVWHVELQLLDLSFLPISMEMDLGKALTKVRCLSQEFKIPFDFIDSEPLSERQELAPSVTCRSTSHGWQLVTGWTLADGWRLLGLVFDRVGLLLFAILFDQFAAQFGEFLARVWLRWQDYGVIVLDISPLFQVFQGFTRWDWLGLAIAGGMLVWEGAQLSMEKRLSCDRKTLRLKNTRQPSTCISDRIDGIVFLPQPTPLLAIWDSNNQVMEIRDLPRLDDYREIGHQVSQSLLS